MADAGTSRTNICKQRWSWVTGSSLAKEGAADGASAETHGAVSVSSPEATNSELFYLFYLSREQAGF